MIRKIYQYGVRIAAVLIILFGLSVFYQYLTATPEKLFNENYQSYNLRETRGVSANSLEFWYKKGNMDSLIQEFNGLKSPQTEDYFLVGNAFLITHQPAKAIESFLAIDQINKTANTHSYEEDAEYYLALSWLDNKEPGKALPVLEKIHADPGHPYNKKVSAWFLMKVKRSI
jgi:tetratricopeptide (TPR) repeat protein